MKEEYFIYHRNAFSRILHSLSSVHLRLTQRETTRLLAKKSISSDPEMSSMAARYYSDHERTIILRSIIRDLQSALAANVEKMSVPCPDKIEELVAENRSLRASLRRRNSELDRLKASMDDIYESIDTKLGNCAADNRKNKSVGRFRLGFSAAASLL